MSEKEGDTIQLACPCCGSTLTIDPSLPAVLDHKLPSKPQVVAELKDVVKAIHDEAGKREEKYQNILETEKSKGKVLERKFQELLKKAQSEPIEKPIKDIDLD